MKLGTLAIVGVGLIGGSIGKAAKERGLVERIVGIEPNADSALWAVKNGVVDTVCLLYTSPSPRDATLSRMPSSA